MPIWQRASPRLRQRTHGEPRHQLGGHASAAPGWWEQELLESDLELVVGKGVTAHASSLGLRETHNRRCIALSRRGGRATASLFYRRRRASACFPSVGVGGQLRGVLYQSSCQKTSVLFIQELVYIITDTTLGGAARIYGNLLVNLTWVSPSGETATGSTVPACDGASGHTAVCLVGLLSRSMPAVKRDNL